MTKCYDCGKDIIDSSEGGPVLIVDKDDDGFAETTVRHCWECYFRESIE